MDAEPGPGALADLLYGSGALRDPAWREVFLTVERHRFVPDRAWTHGSGGRRDIDRAADPAGWWAAAYADAAVVTQVDDGAADGPGVATSSLSQPTVVAWMLEALDVRPGHRVLEIGTGPGWNAALLAARAGDANVTTVEVDAGVAAAAREALRAAGRAPAVITGDGEAGYRPGAPYDRVIATAGVRRVPYAWVAQTRPGGRIVLPWTPGAGAGALLPLTVADDGTAMGTCGTMLGFMPLRGQRREAGPAPDAGRTAARVRDSAVEPRAARGQDADFVFAVTARLPRLRLGYRMPPGRGRPPSVWVADGRSWARVVNPPSGDGYRVELGGPGDVWADVEALYDRWCAEGRPSRPRHGVTVTPTTQTLWLDTPDHPVPVQDP